MRILIIVGIIILLLIIISEWIAFKTADRSQLTSFHSASTVPIVVKTT